MNNSVFKSKIRNVMLDNKFGRVVRNINRGTVNCSSVYKIGTGSDKIFKKKRAVAGKKYNICILIDYSGSMVGPRIRVCGDILRLLIPTFQDVDLNFSVIGFADYVAENKKFGQKIPRNKLGKDCSFVEDVIMRCFYHNGGNSGKYGTVDKESYFITSVCHDCTTDLFQGLGVALKRLKKNTSGKNILIVLTDGVAGSSNYDSRVATCPQKIKEKFGKDGWFDRNFPEVLLELQKLEGRGVEILGVGIQHQFVSRIFHNYIIVDDLHDLKNKILKYLASVIKRGR